MPAPEPPRRRSTWPYAAVIIAALVGALVLGISDRSAALFGVHGKSALGNLLAVILAPALVSLGLVYVIGVVLYLVKGGFDGRLWTGGRQGLLVRLLGVLAWPVTRTFGPR